MTWMTENTKGLILETARELLHEVDSLPLHSKNKIFLYKSYQDIIYLAHAYCQSYHEISQFQISDFTVSPGLILRST